jgi:hypothetical protein
VIEYQALRLPILGDQNHTRSDRIAGLPNLDLLALDPNFARRQRVNADNGSNQFASSGPNNPGDPNDFTAMDREANFAKPAISGSQLFTSEHFFATRSYLGRKNTVNASADHVFEHDIHRDIGGGMSGY